jgi:anti-sigma factor RsiW
VRCDDLAELLSASVDDGGELADRRARRHVQSCLRCQAELAQYRRLVRALQALRDEVAVAPGLVDDVLAAIEAAGERSAVRALLRGRRVAYVGGLAAAAGAGAAIVLASRARRPLAS